jgi:hypothetical protein
MSSDNQMSGHLVDIFSFTQYKKQLIGSSPILKHYTDTQWDLSYQWYVTNKLKELGLELDGYISFIEGRKCNTNARNIGRQELVISK